MKMSNKKIIGIIIYVLMFIAIGLMFIPKIKDMRVYYKIGDIANKDVFANRDVEDLLETRRLKEEAENKIPIQTSLAPAIGNNARTNLNKLFQEIINYRNDSTTQDIRKVSHMNDSSQFIKNYSFSGDDLKAVLAFSAEDFLNLRMVVETFLDEAFAKGIEKGKEEDAIVELNQKFTENTDSAEKASIAAKIFQKEVKVNMLDDLKLTSELKKKASSEIEPVMIRKGALIVSEGMTITEREIILLEQSELLLEEGKTDRLLWFASIIIIILIAIMLYLGLYALDPKFLGSIHFYITVAVILLIAFISYSFSRFGIIVVPIVFSVVLLSSWVDGEMSIWINVFLLWILHFLIGLSSLETAIFTLQIFTLSVLIYRARDFKGRFKVVMFTSVVSLILILCSDVLIKTPISHSLISCLAKLVVDSISAVIAIFLAPLFNKNMRASSSSLEDEFSQISQEIGNERK